MILFKKKKSEVKTRGGKPLGLKFNALEELPGKLVKNGYSDLSLIVLEWGPESLS